MFRQILVPVDGSLASFNAVDQAFQFASDAQSMMTTLCVIDRRLTKEAYVYLPVCDKIDINQKIEPAANPTVIYQTWAQQVTDYAQARGVAAKVRMRPEIITGIPYQEIISRSSQYDLIVMGIQETSSYPGPFLAGSTLQHVVTKTHLPVLCVPAPPKKLRTILVAYDDSRIARDALQLCATLARIMGLTLIVLTVQQNGKQAQQILHQARLRTDPVIPRLVARDGDPARAILNIALHHDCDLIALGVRAHRSILGDSLGQITNTLLRTSQLPLLLSH